MSNRLAGEKSPYLLQHAENPVDWYPWGEEALELARREDKPILVSIGYSACHWCHVMAHESFEDPQTAALMNERFVNIKVDREERPDVDAVYMEAVQALTGQGGWPLNVFLLPDGRPYYGGTYFPPTPRPGLPSWQQIVLALSDAYRTDRDTVLHNAGQITTYLERSQNLPGTGKEPGEETLRAAFEGAARQFDTVDGGFGGAPKFPQPLSLDFVLRMHHRYRDPDALDFLSLTLEKMAAGGIYDQLGGGFHRYSVDSIWLVPHFEKMLYDNALLAHTYLQAYLVTGSVEQRRIVEETLDYLLRDMRSPEGGLYSAEDADSEGVEGKFYTWTAGEMRDVLGADTGQLAMLHYGVTPGGNFEGTNILTLARRVEEVAAVTGDDIEVVRVRLSEARSALFAAREMRVHPGKDTKILASWNALALRALAEAGRALRRPDYVHAAVAIAEFLLGPMSPGGELRRSFREGPGDVPAFLEDYAFLTQALLSLYETVHDVRYFQAAERLADIMISRFSDREAGAFFDTPDGEESLPVRPRSFFDNPIPSGNSAASFALLRLHALSGDQRYLDKATPAFRATRELLARAPLGFGHLLCALDFSLSRQVQIAIAGDPLQRATGDLLREVYERYLPNAVLAVGEGGVPLLHGRTAIGGKPTAYVCEGFSCRLPVTDARALAAQLSSVAV